MIDDALMPEKENGDKKMFGLVIPRIEETNLAELEKNLGERGLVVVEELDLPPEKLKAFRTYQGINGAGVVIKFKRNIKELMKALETIKPDGRFIPENCII